MQMLLAGSWVDRDERIEVRNPEDGALVDTVPAAGVEDMELAVATAVEGARIAASMPIHARMRVLAGAADTIEREHESFACTIATEGIKTIREARSEVTRCVTTLRISAEEARRIHGETIPFDQMPGSENRIGYYRPAPVGVVGVITPFNDPLNLVAHKVGPALAGGNAVVVKPDSKTPLSALRLARALLETGLPGEVLQVVTGHGSEVGAALVEDARVRMISFTGGRATGERIIRSGGLKKFSMELGSNAPVIVMDDADLHRAYDANLSGAFWAAGQNCLHVQRMLIHDAVYDELVGRLVAGAAEIAVGAKLNEDTDMGPLIDEGAAKKVEHLVGDALDSGAHLLCGGTRDGTFYAPTFLGSVPDDARAAREEIYGPVTLLYRVGSLEEAVERANDVDYGLQAAIFTQDVDNAFRAADALRYGGVMINDSTDYRIDAMPFGGFKGSGLGREGVAFALQEMTEPKLVCLDLRGR